MSSLYCWFDWDDNTTTVNSINIIKEPRKPLTEYTSGEKVLAKLPQYGLWNGVIVEISESRKELLQKMADRQKTAAASLESEDNLSIDNDKNPVQTISRQAENDSESPFHSVDNDGHDFNSLKSDKKKVGCDTKRRNTKQKNKDAVMPDYADEDDVSEKTKKSKECGKKRKIDTVENERMKKKAEEFQKLEAKNKQLESIIRERRSSVGQEIANPKPIIPLESGIFPDRDNGYDQNVAAYQDTSATAADHNCQPYWSGSQFGSPYSAFQHVQQYSFMGDLMSPSASCSPSASSSLTLQSLESQKELHDKVERLQCENNRLKLENEQLRKEILELQQQKQGSNQPEDAVITPRKIACLQQIVSAYEKKKQTSVKVLKPRPVRLDFADNEQMEPEVSEHETPKRAFQSRESDEPTGYTGASHWEDSTTSSGMKKVRLVPDQEVFITQGQMSHVKHLGSESARKMTIALLDVFFSREQLAVSCARGGRQAHNSDRKTCPLPGEVVCAIKQFVLNHFKKDNGEPCMKDTLFNDVINSKCATARRALKRNP